jgi:hypothetical protein
MCGRGHNCVVCRAAQKIEAACGEDVTQGEYNCLTEEANVALAPDCLRAYGELFSIDPAVTADISTGLEMIHTACAAMTDPVCISLSFRQICGYINLVC